jgi:hypothetical protein
MYGRRGNQTHKNDHYKDPLEDSHHILTGEKKRKGFGDYMKLYPRIVHVWDFATPGPFKRPFYAILSGRQDPFWRITAIFDF